MTKEWDWDCEAEEVNLDRLHTELSNIPATVALSYLRVLANKSPIVYQRYRDREIKRRGEYQYWNWTELDKNLRHGSRKN